MEALSLEDFIVNHMNAESPVVVSGMMSEWPCFSCPERKWTTDYLRRIAGLRTVPVEIGARCVIKIPQNNRIMHITRLG